MENTNNPFAELLKKIEAVLDEYKCKSETRINPHDALLFGKFQHYMEKYTITVHIKEENYKPVTHGSDMVRRQEDPSVIQWMPTLERPVLTTPKGNCSEEEQFALRDRFIREAAEIGKEFLQRMQQGK